jgi:hypothetical protein
MFMRPAQPLQASAKSEAIMAYLAHDSAFQIATSQRQTSQPGKRRRSLWRAILDAVMTAHQRDAQRDIDRLVARSGGKFTDSMEREIGDHMMRHTWDVGP